MSEHHEKPQGDTYEPVSISVKSIIFALVGLAIIMSLGFGLMALFLGQLGNFWPAGPSIVQTEDEAAITQRTSNVDNNQFAQRQRYMKAQEEKLSSYGWIDKKEGVARIPIERAMSLYVEQTSVEQKGEGDE